MTSPALNPRPGRAQKFRIILPLAIMLAMFVVSSLPGTDDAAPQFLLNLKPSWQNALHIPAYAILTLAWFWALLGAVGSTRRTASIGALITLLFGVLDEYNQSAVPGRTGSVMDLVLNATGVLVALVIFFLWRYFSRR